MGQLKNELLDLRTKMEEEIFKKGWEPVKGELGHFLRGQKYNDSPFIEYFTSASVEEKRAVVEVFLGSERKNAMEVIIIYLLNAAQLETKEELADIFSSLRN